MTIAFTDLNLCEPVLRALTEEGYTTPTPIQEKAIPHILEGRDVLGCAQTGTGKTAAFALPIIHRLLADPKPAVRGPGRARVLVLSPTRELATQIADSFKTYGRHSGLTGAVIYGGVSQRPQEMHLARGVDILVATPGRLLDLTEQGCVNYSNISTFVLDEADRMLDMGFITPIRNIAARLAKVRQTLLFSATMPREIVHLAESLLKDPVRVSVAPVSSAAPLIEQSVYMVNQPMKQALLAALVLEPKVERAVVFTKTKHGADKLCKKLMQSGIGAVAIHGNKNQNQRQRSLDGFKSGRHKVLVATDVAARGLDVDAITHVFNYDLPLEPESYVHRIGRTGRAGATGVAIAFCDPGERGLLRAIERMTGKKLPVHKDLPHAAMAALPVIPQSAHDTDSHSSRDRRPMPAHRNSDSRGEGRRDRSDAPRSYSTPSRHPHAPREGGHGGAAPSYPARRTEQGQGQGQSGQFPANKPARPAHPADGRVHLDNTPVDPFVHKLRTGKAPHAGGPARGDRRTGGGAGSGAGQFRGGFSAERGRGGKPRGDRRP